MVRKKRQSKRVSLHKKYKIQRRVREHHRKIRREAKKNPSKRRKLEKDPGVPNLYPFKEQFIEAMERRKEKEERERGRQKEDRRKLQEKKRLTNIQNMVESARERQQQYELLQKAHTRKSASGATSQSTDVSGSRRAYYREFKKVIAAADVILEVLDARDPLGCRCPEVERMILTADPNKKIILILNKIDLIPRSAVEKWLKYMRDEYPTLAFKCSTQKQRDHIGHAKMSINTTRSATTTTGEGLQTSECLGAENLLQLLKNYCRSANIKTSITVGIIGYPNVGKSSLINSLKRSRAVGVGATPGFTKSMQEIHIDKHIKLLDCPGIVFSTEASDSDLILRNAVQVEQLADPITPVEAILRRCPPRQLMEIYTIPAYEDCKEFLAHIATNMGKLQKKGIPDYDKAAIKVLHDWNSGKIPFYTEPPEVKEGVHLSASVVSSWGQELQIDDILSKEHVEIMKELPDDEAMSSSSSRGEMINMGSGSLNSGDSNWVQHLINDSDDDNEDEDEDDEENMDDSDENDDSDDNNSKVVRMTEEEEEEEEENDDEDDNEISKQTKVLTRRSKKLLYDEEDEHNLQLGKTKRKQQKQKKKLEKKLSKSTNNKESVFSFATDFVADYDENNDNDEDDDDEDDIQSTDDEEQNDEDEELFDVDDFANGK